ncbi:hypothetical protein AVEN_242630-1 [Araneus ventricosus]|uniref:C2H2-type domain-containing protein n=1 Tax=Araneus ventricosus TaxID=182803 RepID=A0A4Y2V407_ARAVE|nr:hypothetical protein AVEN_242630-1 [Araneus ventricosus]
MENCEESYRSKISDRKTLSSKINKENYPKLRNKVQINYSDDMKNTDGEDSDSDFSSDSSSSDDDETAQEQKRKMKHDLPKKLNCLLCKQYFSTHLSYLTHKRSHESKPFRCILCRKGCENRPCFLNHMKKLHPEVDPFVCEYRGCEQNFKTQKRLEIHRKIHWRYMCKYCKKLFVRKHHMKKHVLKIH